MKGYMHASVHCSTVYNSQDRKQHKGPSTDGCMKTYVHMYNGTYSAIKKNEIMTFAATRMDLEMITLSGVSQRKTNIM